MIPQPTSQQFLGTLAGNPIYSNPLYTKSKQPTYSRLYQPFGGSDDLRKKLFQRIVDSASIDAFKSLGEEYSYTPPHLQDSRNFSSRPGYMQGGGFFLTIKKSAKISDSAFAYALTTFAKHLELTANLPLHFVLQLLYAYGISYILHKYFEPVDSPKDGNLAIYQFTSEFQLPSGSTIPPHSPVHAGIFRNSQPNWNSPSGGTIESKLSFFLNSYVFQHDCFFLPSTLGNHISFYQLKNPKLNIPKPLPTSSPPSNDPTYSLHNNEFLLFNPSQENQSLRDQISSTFGPQLPQRFPQIQLLNYIHFTGVCFHYALGRITQTFTASAIHICLEGNTHIIKKYFTHTLSPQKGDLVLYYTTPNTAPVHYGIYHSHNLIESKWGCDQVYRHPPFYVTNSYGNYIKFYKLNDDLTPQSFLEKLNNEKY